MKSVLTCVYVAELMYLKRSVAICLSLKTLYNIRLVYIFGISVDMILNKNL